MNSSKNIKIVHLASMVLYLLSLNSCENVEISHTNNFDKYFTLEQKIELDTSLVSFVEFLDINKRGNLLVSNKRKQQVTLYDSAGKLIRDLKKSALKNHPGLHWSPVRAFFRPDQTILVSNRIPWGLIFDSSGNYKTVMPRDFRAPLNMAFDSLQYIYGFNSNHKGYYLKKLSPKGKELKQFGSFPQEYKHIIDKAVIGNDIVIDSNNFIYHKYISAPTIYKYNRNGELIDKYSKEPPYYKPMESDLSKFRKGGVSRMKREILEIAKSSTANYSLHLLENNILLIQYVNYGGYYGLQLLKTNGEYLLDEPLVIDEKVYAAKNGNIYTVNNQRFDKNNPTRYLPPLIKVYKLRDSVLGK